MESKQKAYKTIKELVKRFGEHVDEYKRGNYSETQTRVDFIDPFFTALGWDMYNKQGLSEAYREVIHEYKMKVGGATNAPDYCFTVYGQRKFFVDAKKPSIDVKANVAPAYQVKRYGWSAKLPIAVVTDFEEFSIYDCYKKPKQTDKSSEARISYLTYDNYLDEFDFIYGTFAKESVLKGSFDKFVLSDTKKKGTATVDNEFLKSIEEWRTYLATTIALRNKSLNEDEINYAVQKTIDRIIFLRICEDRGIEQYGELKNSLKDDTFYERLFKLFRSADEKYNSGLFDFKEDTITPTLKIDDKAIKRIINELYYPVSPFEFSVLPADILGSVYERFLGKTIRLTKAHYAKIEEKPEVRKAGGVYYTPKYIVDYIVENTVGKLLKGKKPKDVEKLKIVDPACGSGSFLIGAYRYLLDWHLKYYLINPPSKNKDNPLTPDGNLTTAEKKRILLNNIYGVDIDSQAVEVTKLNLLLKALEGETKASIDKQLTFLNERVLPNLEDNIKCGNSLIGTDFYDEQPGLFTDNIKKINTFDWDKAFPEIFKNGGFDAVIGNPPYDVLEKERKMEFAPHTALQEYVKNYSEYKPALGGKLNLFRFFVIKFIKVTKPKGRFGFIIPLSILADKSCASSRAFLFDSSKDLLADCFPQKDNSNRRIFKDAKLSTMVVTGTCSSHIKENEKNITVKTYPWNSFNDKHKKAKILIKDLKLIDPQNLPVPLVDQYTWQLLSKIYNKPNVVPTFHIKDFNIRRGEINQTIFRKFITENTKHSRLIKGVEIGQYRINEKLSQGKREYFNEAAYLKKNEPKSFVYEKRIATQRITGVDERLRIVATIIQPVTYFADSTNSIHQIKDSPYNIYYILALLNSTLFQWRFKHTSTNNNVGTNELEAMPFRRINFLEKEEVKNHDTIVKFVDNLLHLNKDLHATTLTTQHEQIQRAIDHAERKIDELVYELYGLSEEEVRIVEGV